MRVSLEGSLSLSWLLHKGRNYAGKKVDGKILRSPTLKVIKNSMNNNNNKSTIGHRFHGVQTKTLASETQKIS